MTLLVSLLLTAAPIVGSTFSGTLNVGNDVVFTAKAGGRNIRQAGQVSTSISFKAKVDAGNPTRPTELTVTGRGLPGAPVKVRDDGGAVTLIPGADSGDDGRAALQAHKGWLSRLVLEDAERASMSSCSDKTAAAIERWLKRFSAELFQGETSETKLENVKTKCSEKKGRVVHEVSWDATIAVGVTVNQVNAKGTLTVDPALWLTTWNVSGPMSVVQDSRVNAKAKGTFRSKLEVSR